MRGITPYLQVTRAAEAIAWYARVFDAKEVRARLVAPDGSCMNAEIEIEGTRLMLADELPKTGSRSPATLGGTSVVLDLLVADADAVFARALAHGAEPVYPLADQFYGHRAGRVRDPFGHHWIIATHQREVSDTELVAGFTALFGAPSEPVAAPLTIDAWVPAPPQVAWDAFTTPAAITQWNQASPDWHCPAATVDLRVGGQHSARMEARDGSTGFDLEGTYEAVDPARAITLRLADGRRAHTTFVTEGEGTRITTTFDPEASNPVELQRAGWQAILDSYAAYVRAHPGSYIDGFVAAVPTAHRAQYRAHVEYSAAVFMEHGATRVVESWGDDVPEGELTSFPKAVQKRADETVCFSWIEWPSKAARDAGMQKVFADPRMHPDHNPMPFDGKRLIFGGFQPLVEAGRPRPLRAPRDPR